MGYLNEFLDTGLMLTIDSQNAGTQFLSDNYQVDNISDEFKQKCESIIIKFMVDANTLLTEDELKRSPIGTDLWFAIHGNNKAFILYYHKGEELLKITKQFDSLEAELNDSIRR